MTGVANVVNPRPWGPPSDPTGHNATRVMGVNELEIETGVTCGHVTL